MEFAFVPTVNGLESVRRKYIGTQTNGYFVLYDTSLVPLLRWKSIRLLEGLSRSPFAYEDILLFLGSLW